MAREAEAGIEPWVSNSFSATGPLLWVVWPNYTGHGCFCPSEVCTSQESVASFHCDEKLPQDSFGLVTLNWEDGSLFLLHWL